MKWEGYEFTEPCEICWANNDPDYGLCTMEIYIIDTHCIELRRNRKAREHKNTQPKCTVF